MEKTANFQFLRLMFMLGIFLLHCGMPWFSDGAVSFFFVVSGFLYRDISLRSKYIPYLTHKARKLYAPYLAALLFYCLAFHFQFSSGFIIHLMLLQSWIPVTTQFFFGYMGVAWFLSSLLFCYCFFPMAASILSRLTGRKSYAAAYISIALTLFLLRQIDYGDYQLWAVYINPLFCLMEFTLGYLTCKVISSIQTIPCHAALPIVAFVIYLLTLHFVADVATYPIVHTAMLSFMYLWKNRKVESVISHRYVLRAANYIIWFYLFHQMIINLCLA